MTTPAVNISDIVVSNSVNCFRRLTPPVSPWDCRGRVRQAVKWVSEQRPKSGNSAMIGHFRICREWQHDKFEWSREPSLDSHVYTPPGFNQTELRAEEGSYWSTASPSMSALPPSTNMVNRAVTEALANLKRQDIHLGNFLAEFKKTQEMIVSRSSTIARQVRGFRKSNPKLWPVVVASEVGNLPRHLWCTIPKGWLELQYGWIPLMSDVMGAAAHLSKLGKKSLPYVFSRAQFSDHEITSSSVPGAFGGADCTYRFRHDRKVACHLVYSIRSPGLAELSSLGLLNPAEIVWEMTRYSFVVDWFLPFGTWLSSLTGAAGMDFVTGSISQMTNVKFDGATVMSRPHYAVSSSGPSFKGSGFRMRRSCMTNTPSPGLYLKNPLTGVHVANALALLAGAFR